LESLKSFSEVINEQFKVHNIPAEHLKTIEENVKELVKGEISSRTLEAVIYTVLLDLFSTSSCSSEEDKDDVDNGS
jgi:hypothetical protein